MQIQLCRKVFFTAVFGIPLNYLLVFVFMCTEILFSLKLESLNKRDYVWNFPEIRSIEPLEGLCLVMLSLYVVALFSPELR